MQLSNEIFNILKGANVKLKLFDPMGNKTLDPELSARFYAYDNDFLVTIREEEDEVELVVQAGASFNFDKHKDVLDSIKQAGHNAMAEYSIRKFDKNIEPKDFAHDVVKEDDRTEKAMKDMQPSAVTGYYEITDFWKEHTQMWDKSVDEVMQMIYEWTWIEMTTATRDRDELAKRTLAIVVDALRNKKDDMTFDDMIAQLESKNEDVRRLRELSGIKEDASSPVFQIMKKSLLRHKWYLENEEMDPNMVSSELRDVNDMIEAVDIGEHEPYFDTAVNDDYRGLYREAIAKLKGKKTSIYGVDNDVLPPNAKPNPKSAYNSGEVERNDAELDALNTTESKKVTEAEKRWKQTSMSPEEAIAKYGKENVKVKKGALRNGDDMVEVFVESFEVNPNAGHRDQMAHPENQMGTGPGIKTKPKLRPANLGKKFPTTKPKLRPDNLGEAGGNSVEAFMSHVVDHAKEIQADNYRMTDSSYYEFTDEIDTDDEEFMSMPQVQAILKAIPHVDMENTDIKHAIDVLASGELLEAETESYSPGDEMEDGVVSNCCGAQLMDYNDGHGRCSDCKEMAAGESEEEYYESWDGIKNAVKKGVDTLRHGGVKFGKKGVKFTTDLRKPQTGTVKPQMESYSPATGSMKTSYIQLPENTKLIIKHTKGVNEEVRGSRSRNIKALFIENSAGERFRFPHKYLQGAKAMANHVSNGGTPYDAIGESIVNLCTEVAQCTQFLRHVRTNKLTNEGNENIVETIKQKLKEFKNTVKSLQTSRGYNAYQAPTTAIVEDNDKESVDLTDKFMYNTFETANMDSVLETVARIIKERDSMTDLTKSNMNRLYDMIKNKEDFKLNIDPNDPEHPDNEDPIKYSGGNGAMAKLVSHLSFLAMNSKNDEVFNLLSQISGEMYSLPKEHVILLAKIAKYLDKNNKAPAKEPAMEDLAEATLNSLRRKIA